MTHLLYNLEVKFSRHCPRSVKHTINVNMRCVGGVKKNNRKYFTRIKYSRMGSDENSTKLKAILCSRDEIKTRSFKIAHPVKK